jgi:hypothetical protein
MPRGRAGKQQPAHVEPSWSGVRRIQKSDEWGGFAQVNLDESRREEFELWASEMGEGIYRELDDALGSGLKFTMAYDGKNECYIASLTGRPDSSGVRAFTCCLSARAGTFAEAIALLMYKHVALLHLDWWDAVNTPSRVKFAFG